MNKSVRDPRAAAIRWYEEQAARLRLEAQKQLRAGQPEIFYEWIGLASIADRAAKAEVIDRRPRDE